MSDNSEEKHSTGEDARRAEALGEDVEIEWKGATYRIPRDYSKWPYAYTLAAEKGLTAVALEQLLGPKQLARFVRTDPTMADFNEFDRLLGAALGTSAGESEASSD